MNTYDLQYKLIYSIVVAGKSAKFAENVMSRFCEQSREPFQTIMAYHGLNQLSQYLKECRAGNYTKLSKCLPMIVHLDLSTCTVDELEAIHGIGPKTARFFLLWTRPGVRYAALDTHVLKWLREKGYNAPKSTPSGKKYKLLESAFIAEADKLGYTPRELDYAIWVKYSGYQDAGTAKQLELV